ncbi:MAG: TetR family transcriptional regulator, partial [Acetobacteraceae bacterium]|nr:TetR family transcriptional regulator [Acetobacteraceae bacterium]
MRDEIQAYKRERILQEAVKLFYARGFTGTTLDDIAAALGVTKPFIYTHFRSKTELLSAICLPPIEQSLAAAVNAVNAPGSPKRRLRCLIEDFTKAVLGSQANIAILFREEKHLPTETSAELDRQRKEFDHLLGQLLEEGNACGEFRIG